MDPELAKVLLDTGLPSGLLVVVIAMQWRRRSVSARRTKQEEVPGAVYYQLSALAQDIRDLARDDSDYHKAHELAARERQKELLAAIRERESA